MTNGPAIVIKGTHEYWPDGPRKLTALESRPGTQPPDLLVRRRARPGRQPGMDAAVKNLTEEDIVNTVAYTASLDPWRHG